MKEITLNNTSKVIEFKESKFSKKNLSTIKNFQKLVKDNGDNGLRTISSILGEKSLNSFKVKKSEFKTSE